MQEKDPHLAACADNDIYANNWTARGTFQASLDYKSRDVLPMLFTHVLSVLY